MTSTHPPKTANPCKSKDCSLIMEAIRRLLDGTWRLKDEDADYSWELLPKIKEALEEHIHFEEEIIFQQLAPDERAVHRSDHNHLIELLQKTLKALEHSKPEKFQQHLRELVLNLNIHHREFDLLATGIRSVLEKEGAHLEEPVFKRVGSTL